MTNINNDYIPLNSLTPFKLCVLQNFPFIEVDFDGVTNYQLLCKVVEYLNKVIDNNNKQNSNITQLEENFIRLYNYVKDYFNNLDVQEEINNKLDEMAKEGSLTNIIFDYNTPYTVYAHRGYTRGSSLLAQPNSPWAIAYAKNVGCNGVEIDVRQDINGTYVCLHDDDVNSISNSKGSITTWNYINVLYKNGWNIDTDTHLLSVRECVRLCRMLGLSILFDLGKIGGEHAKPISDICVSENFKNYGFYDIEDYGTPDYSVFSNLPLYVKKFADIRNVNPTLNDIKNVVNAIGTTINVGFRLYVEPNLTEDILKYLKDNNITLGAINLEEILKYSTEWCISDGIIVVPDDANTHYSVSSYRGINGLIRYNDVYGNASKSFVEMSKEKDFGGNTQRITCGQCLSSQQKVLFPNISGSSGVNYLTVGSDGYDNFNLVQSRSIKTPLRVIHSSNSFKYTTELTLENNFSFWDEDFTLHTKLADYLNDCAKLIDNNVESIREKMTLYIRGSVATNLTDVNAEYKNYGLMVEYTHCGFANNYTFGFVNVYVRRTTSILKGWFENNILYLN